MKNLYPWLTLSLLVVALLLFFANSISAQKQFYQANFTTTGTTVNAVSYIEEGEILFNKIILRDLAAGQDGSLIFSFPNLTETDDMTIRLTNPADDGTTYYRFRFAPNQPVEGTYLQGAVTDTFALVPTTPKNNNIFRIERCGGQFFWYDTDNKVRFIGGSDTQELIAVVEATVASDVTVDVVFTPETTACDICMGEGGTTLYSGDLAFYSYDNFAGTIKTGATNDPLEKDWLAVRTQVDLSPGTSFILSEAVYEYSSENWYAGSDATNKAQLASQRITYLGTTTITR